MANPFFEASYFLSPVEVAAVPAAFMVGIKLDIFQPVIWTILGMDLGFKEQGDDLGPDMVPSFTVRGMSPVFM